MEPKYVFEQFSESELMFNLTNHFVGLFLILKILTNKFIHSSNS